MANPTVQVQSHWSDWDDGSIFYWPVDSSVSTTYQTGELIGRNSSGYATHFDDTGAMEFMGILDGIHRKFDSTDTGSLSYLVRIKRARYLTIPLSTGTVGRAESNGAIGKLVYSQYSGACFIDSSTLTYANVVGRIVDIGDAATQPDALTSTRAVVVETVPFKATGGVRWLAATGNQTINVVDIGKTIFVPNSANLTLTLPAIAACPIGGELKFVRTATGGNTTIVTLDGNANETINNSTTYGSVQKQYDTATIQNTGVEWIITHKILN